MARALTLVLAAAAICTVALGGSAASAAPVSGAGSSARAESAKFVPGELLVRFRDGVGPDQRLAVRRAEDARFRHTLPVEGIQLVALERDKSVLSAASALERRPEVLYAEPNYYRHVTAVPNDPDFGQLWGLNNTGQLVKSATGVADSDIDATEAWDITTGSPNVVVGIADTGVAYDHPDLAPQIWSNPGETGEGRETNGKDDDRNGLVDDWRGWDWVDHDNDPSDPNSHGTHVAGTIGARGNDGAGVVGVNWNVKLMPLRIAKADGTLTDLEVLYGFDYAGANGAKVVNASFGAGGGSQVMLDLLKSHPRTLFVAAAGNGGEDSIGDDNDAAPQFPCGYEAANVLCVAATDQSDGLASFSNFGAKSVDLGAPGRNVLSDRPPSFGVQSAFEDGTSMAAPHVAGAAALVSAKYPTLSTTGVRQALLEGVDPRPSLAGKTVTGGRLNVFNALQRAKDLLPALELGGPARQGMKKRSVAILARCAKLCALVTTGRVTVAGASKTVQLRGVSRSLPAGKRRRLKLRLGRKSLGTVKRALAKGRSVSAVVTATAYDKAGSSTSSDFTVTLKR